MAERYAQEKRRESFGRLIGSPIGMFLKMYLFKKGFRDGREGLVLSCIYSYYTFLKYAKLWELRHPAANKNITLQ
jgi:hypothetical protein